MSFFSGLVTGLVLGHQGPKAAQSWKPDPGVIHGRGYLGLGSDFPVQILVSSSKLPSGTDSSKVLVKWIAFAAASSDFATAEWTWMTAKKIDGVLHFID